MKKATFIFLLFLILPLLTPGTTKANSFDIGPQKINKFGIHLADTTNIEYAAELVNSSGGDWGWVTVVLRKDEQNYQQWQDFFNQLREKHLVPIVRLATEMQNDIWRKPTKRDIDETLNFLSKLNWPIKYRFIVVFNEPNHGKEWGGRANPREYAKIFLYTCRKFKQLSSDFFILLAGPDQAAPHQPPNYYSPQIFYIELTKSTPEILDCMDGLASHSYPNHGFIGSPKDRGWGSIRGYEEELKLLKLLGLKKDLPIFITETGWPHKEGQKISKEFYSASILSKYFEQAFSIWNNDKNIYSFTPFLLYFPEEIFSNFSWLDKNKKPYPFYYATQKIPKKSWSPPQLNRGTITKADLPPLIFPETEYQALIRLRNEGQKIWEDNSFCWETKSSESVIASPLCSIEEQKILPGKEGWFRTTFKIQKTNQSSFDSQKKIKLGWNGVGEITLKRVVNQENITIPLALHKLKKRLIYWYNTSIRKNLSRTRSSTGRAPAS